MSIDIHPEGEVVGHQNSEEDTAALSELERQAERIVTLREAFEYGFKAGLAKAGLTSNADSSYEAWLWSREVGRRA